MNEKKTKTYTFDGMDLKVPLIKDAKTGMFLEDYREWLENVVYTPNGHPIMFSGEDACELAQEKNLSSGSAVGTKSEQCPDCGSCKFYRRAGEHTWIGVCVHEEKNYPKKKEETQYD